MPIQPLQSSSPWLRRILGNMLTFAVFGSLLVMPCPARADVEACIQAHSTGQREAKAGRLRAATKLFAACGSEADCPDPIRSECVEFYRGLEQSLPTVIFAAADEEGRDLSNVQIYSGHRMLSARLDGRAMALDPGKYVFRFVFPQRAVTTTEAVIREGEKNRVILVRLPTRAKDPPTGLERPSAGSDANQGGQLAQTLPPAENSTKARDLPVGFWISTGAAGAALAAWGTFALLGRHEESKLDLCAPDCDAARRGDYDAMRRDYLIADLSLGASAVAAGAAAWFLLNQPRTNANTEQRQSNLGLSRVAVVPSVAVNGVSLVMRADL